MDHTAHGVSAFQQQQRARPPLLGEFQGEAGPDQGEEGNGQNGMLDSLKGQHTEFVLRMDSRVRGRHGTRLPETEADDFTDPVASLVKHHEADSYRNNQKIKLAYPLKS